MGFFDAARARGRGIRIEPSDSTATTTFAWLGAFVVLMGLPGRENRGQRVQNQLHDAPQHGKSTGGQRISREEKRARALAQRRACSFVMFSDL